MELELGMVLGIFVVLVLLLELGIFLGLKFFKPIKKLNKTIEICYNIYLGMVLVLELCMELGHFQLLSMVVELGF